MSRDIKSKLDEAWNILKGASIGKNGYMHPNDSVDNKGVIGITSFKRHESYWENLLTGLAMSGLDKNKEMSVLITACSVGAEVYDAARIAKSLGLKNLHFYGHDISMKFTQRASEGIYPIDAVVAFHDPQSLFALNSPCEGYATIRKECFDNVSFLEPSDIRDLKGTFDIVSENIMNPCPPDIEALVIARARHLAISMQGVIGISNEFFSAARNMSSMIHIPESAVRLHGQKGDPFTPVIFQPRKNPDENSPGSFRLDLL